MSINEDDAVRKRFIREESDTNGVSEKVNLEDSIGAMPVLPESTLVWLLRNVAYVPSLARQIFGRH